MVKKFFSYAINLFFLIICFGYFIDSISVFSFHSKRNILFLFGLILLILIFIFIKRSREVLIISIISVFSFDLIFNFFLQDKFQNVKVRPFLKNSIQLSAEYLNEWPYFKLKPNIIAKTYGDRGDDCIYEWKTDRLGFKNLSVENDYKFVTLGDSYVEGMCTGIDETIAYYLTQKNVKTYNLGVQGWSDRQAVSALKLLKINNITYDGVVFGYLADRFNREANFLNKTEQKGGLGVIIDNDLRKDKSYFISRQIFQSIFSMNKFDWKKQFKEFNLKNFENDLPDNIKIKEEYKNLKLPLNYFPNPIPWTLKYNIDLNDNELINISNKAILNLAKNLNKENKTFIIFIFPLRSDVIGHIVYENGFICTTDYYNAYLRIKKNLINTDYVFIDLFDEAVELTNKFLNTRNYDDFIWKYKDPHYSKTGNKLVANSIKSFIDDGNTGTKKYLEYCN